MTALSSRKGSGVRLGRFLHMTNRLWGMLDSSEHGVPELQCSSARMPRRSPSVRDTSYLRTVRTGFIRITARETAEYILNDRCTYDFDNGRFVKGSLRNRRIVLSSSGHLLLDADADPKTGDHKRRTAWDVVRERFTPEQLTAMVAENPEVAR